LQSANSTGNAPIEEYRVGCRLFLKTGIKDLFPTVKEEHMDTNNRVLGRVGARELTEQEVDTVQGAFQVRHTLTPCFIDKKQQLLNGDQAIGECGP
jgi:hypothetical protein